MEWQLRTVKIAELKKYDKNPRTLSERGHRILSDSLDEYGLVEKPVVNADYVIISGHQRVEILLEKGETDVQVWFPDTLLTEKQVEKLNIVSNKNVGEWCFDILANQWDVADLLNWGFDEDDLGLGKTEKPKKPEKAVITLEFSDKDTMLEYMTKCESIAEESSAKMKVKG